MGNPAVAETDLSDYPELLPTRETSVVYTLEKGIEILSLYVEGKSLHAISKMEGMPSYGTILRWLRDQSKFVDGLEGARRARAIHFEEKAISVAEVDGHIHKDDVAGERLKFDTFKWAAEVNDPSRFGKKVTLGGDSKNPIIFKVITGVPAPTAEQSVVTLNEDGTQKKALPDIEVETVVPNSEDGMEDYS